MAGWKRRLNESSGVAREMAWAFTKVGCFGEQDMVLAYGFWDDENLFC